MVLQGYRHVVIHLVHAEVVFGFDDLAAQVLQ